MHKTFLPATKLTTHASKRRQQRSIPPAVIDYAIEFGRCTVFRGAESYSFDNKGWRRLSAYLGPQEKSFERYRHVYVVISDDGSAITVAYKH